MIRVAPNRFAKLFVRAVIISWVISKPLNKRLFSHFCCTHVTHREFLTPINTVYLKISTKHSKHRKYICVLIFACEHIGVGYAVFFI